MYKLVLGFARTWRAGMIGDKGSWFPHWLRCHSEVARAGWPWGWAEWTDGLPLAQSSSCALAVPAQLCLGTVTILPQLQEGWGLGVPWPTDSQGHC